MKNIWSYFSDFSLPLFRLPLKVKKIFLFVLFCSFSLVLSADESSAALFSKLTDSGSEIFRGMKTIIYAVSGFGIVAIAIGGFFGNLNWKWLSAIIIGLMVIAATAGILMYMTETDISSSMNLQDSLISAAPQTK